MNKSDASVTWCLVRTLWTPNIVPHPWWSVEDSSRTASSRSWPTAFSSNTPSSPLHSSASATEIPPRWYVGIYFGVSLVAAMLGGVLVAVMLLLYAAVRDFIGAIVSGDESRLVASEDEGEGPEDA